MAFDYQAALKAGYSPDEIKSYIAQKSGATQPKKKPQGGLEELLPLIGGIGGTVIGSAIAPGAGTIAGGAVGQGAGDILKQLIQGRGVDPGEAALAGLEGGAGSAIGLGVGKILGGTSKFLRGTATSAERSVIKPQVPVGPAAYTEEAGLIQSSKNLGLKGSADAMRQQSSQKYTELKSLVSDALASNKTKVGSSQVTKAVDTALENSNFLPGEPTYEASRTKVLNLIGKQGQNFTLKNLFDAQTKLDSTLTPVYKKIAVGNPLSPIEETRLAARTAINNLITDASPEVKNLTTQMSTLHQLAPGLEKSAEHRLRLFGIPLPTKVIQAGQTQGAGITNALGNMIPEVGTNTAAVGGQLGLNALIGGLNGAPPRDVNSMETSSSPVTTPTESQPSAFSEDQLKTALLTDLVSTGGKNVEKIKAVYQLLNPQGSQKPKTESQVARDQVSFLVQDALSQIQNNPNIKTGLLAPRIEEAKSIFNAGDPATVDFNRTLANIQATIAKARAGTSFTPNEQKLLNQYTPVLGDSYQQIVSKLTQLNRLFANSPTATTPDQVYGSVSATSSGY